MLKALLFDMDGVIAESEKPKFRFLKKTLKSFGIELGEDKFQRIVGRPVRTFLAEYLQKPDLEEKVWKIFEEDYLNRITEYISPIRTTVEFIKRYDGSVQLGIVSSGIQRINEKVAKCFGIYENLSVIVSREAVTNLKPAPDLYLKAAELLKVNCSNCAAIEDTIVGAQSVLSAKIRCFIFLNDYNTKKEFTNLNISGFIESGKDIKDIFTKNT